MNEPILVSQESFQDSWIEAARILSNKGFDVRNLVVYIKNPLKFDQSVHNKFESFFSKNNILSPKHVAYTIFPHKLYERCCNSAKLFDEYNREKGFFSRVKTSWGTYFRRMTCYCESQTNQLDNIIKAIKSRTTINKAAYTIVIQKPGTETTRPRGGPCLNYMAVQLDPNKKTISILAIYRNHDFLHKAYGNYWGLSNLLGFLAKESGLNVGSLTCISSRAYVEGNKSDLIRFLGTL